MFLNPQIKWEEKKGPDKVEGLVGGTQEQGEGMKGLNNLEVDLCAQSMIVTHLMEGG